MVAAGVLYLLTPCPHRFRVCQLVGRMLACAAENSCVIGTELVDATQEAMLVRLKDKVLAVLVALPPASLPAR